MYACVYIPDFPVHAVMRGEPALAGRAVAIVDGPPHLATVVAMNAKARRAGVRLGMAKPEAAELAKVRHRSPAAEACAHAALVDLGFAFSPRVEDTAPDTVVLDLAGLEPLFGPPQKLAARLARCAAELGLSVRIAIAANPDAAIHAARGLARRLTLIPSGREAASLADLPVAVLAPSDEILATLERWGVRTFSALAALPTAGLSERLGQEGVRLQRLARGREERALAVAELALNFRESMELDDPVDLLEPLAFILGRLLDQLVARLTARALATNEIRLQLELEERGNIDLRDEAGNWKLETGNSKIETGNSKLDAGGSSSVIHRSSFSSADPQSLIPDPCSAQSSIANRQSSLPEPRTPNPESRSLRLPIPTRDAKLLLKLLLLNLKADPPRAPVVKVTLAAEPVEPRARQGGLFLPLAPDPERLELTLARIAGVVGKGNVGSPELLDTHRPEAFRMHRFEIGNWKPETGNSKFEIRNSKLETGDSQLGSCNSSFIIHHSSFSSANPQSLIPNPCSLALRVFRPPRAATVEVEEGCPVRVHAPGVRGHVVSVAGPWRTSGDWWRGDRWEREEWDVEISSVVRGQWSVATTPPFGLPSLVRRGLRGGWTTDNGERRACYRIYRHVASGAWFVCGIYD